MKKNIGRNRVSLKRLFSVLLCCIMFCSLLPTSALALSVVEINARKIFENAELQGGDFTFNLTSDELAIDGGTITATNDPEGNIVFRFEIPDGAPPGDYYLIIQEVDTGKTDVIYDVTSKLLILRINDNGTYLQLIERDDGSYEPNGVPIFRNIYNHPLPPTPPQTGDNANTSLLFALVIMSFVGLVTIVIIGRRKKSFGGR